MVPGSLLVLCTAAAAPPENPCTDVHCLPVFYPGLAGSKCYRIPSIIQTFRGTLLAFAEGRLNGCSDQGSHNLVVRRSTDSGKSWGPVITVFKGIVPCAGCPAAVSNPNPVEVKFRNGSTAVLLAFDTMNNPNSAHHGLDMTLWSTDDGLSWGAPHTMAYEPESNVGSLIGPAVGLQATDGTLFFWITKGFLAISNDFGATFTASERYSIGGSECSIAFAADPANSTMIMNCRTGRNHLRSQFYWRPAANGSYIASPPTYPPQFTDPGCQGSILNVNGTLYTSNAAATTGRFRMTIHRSDDAGRTWSDGLLLNAGHSGYSQLVALAPPSAMPLGILFEAGLSGTYDTISFAAFEWQTPPPRHQRWTHTDKGLLSTDGKYCLDWLAGQTNEATMSPCDLGAQHQSWNFTSEGHLTTRGGDADGLVLDWTSRVNRAGGHPVYMHAMSDSLPHQVWRFERGALTTSGSDTLCLTATGGSDSRLTIEMRTCLNASR